MFTWFLFINIIWYCVCMCFWACISCMYFMYITCDSSPEDLFGTIFDSIQSINPHIFIITSMLGVIVLGHWHMIFLLRFVFRTLFIFACTNSTFLNIPDKSLVHKYLNPITFAIFFFTVISLRCNAICEFTCDSISNFFKYVFSHFFLFFFLFRLFHFCEFFTFTNE